MRTLTQHFQDHGYYTLVGGKIYDKLERPEDHWDEIAPLERQKHERRAHPPLTELPNTEPDDICTVARRRITGQPNRASISATIASRGALSVR